MIWKAGYRARRGAGRLWIGLLAWEGQDFAWADEDLGGAGLDELGGAFAVRLGWSLTPGHGHTTEHDLIWDL